MRELTTQSGVTVVINPAKLKVATALKNAIFREIGKSGIKLPPDKIDLKTEITGELVETIVQPILLLDSSPEVEKAIFDCLIFCTYDHEKITYDTFEDIEARADYYEVVIECIKDNLMPFFKNLVSKLKTLQPKSTLIQK